MKKLIYIFSLILLTSVVMSACKKDIPFYNGDVGIYFLPAVQSSGSAVSDSTLVSFAFAKESVKDSIFRLPVQIMGALSASGRAYKLEIDPSSTAKAGVHFDFVNTKFEIKPNQLLDTVKIKFHRTIDMANQRLTLKLKLVSNENFKTVMTGVVTNTTTGARRSFIDYKIKVDDIFGMPSLWSGYFFGKFSKKKIVLMADVLGLTISQFNDGGQAFLNKENYYGLFVQRYLNDLASAGQTVYDEDGTPMKMGDNL